MIDVSSLSTCFHQNFVHSNDVEGVEIKENSVATQLGFQEHRVCEALALGPCGLFTSLCTYHFWVKSAQMGVVTPRKKTNVGDGS